MDGDLSRQNWNTWKVKCKSCETILLASILIRIPSKHALKREYVEAPDTVMPRTVVLAWKSGEPANLVEFEDGRIYRMGILGKTDKGVVTRQILKTLTILANQRMALRLKRAARNNCLLNLLLEQSHFLAAQGKAAIYALGSTPTFLYS